MSRNRLTALAALGLVVAALGVYSARRASGGVDAGPPGTSTWEVTVTARGEFPTAKAAKKAEKASTLTIYSPPDFRRQHVSDESWKSEELTRPDKKGAKGPREKTLWKARPGGQPEKGYRLTYSFHVVVGSHHPTPAMNGRTKQLDAAPKGPADRTLKATARIQSERKEVRDLADELGAAGDPLQRLQAFYNHVSALPFQNGPGQTALDCLRNGGGDDAGKSRLLVALCRSKQIPARVVVGLVLNPNAPPALHRWVEAWMKTPERPEPSWVPVCPTYGHFGHRRWPANYLVVRIGDGPVVAGPGAPRVSYFARPLPDGPASSRVQAFWRAVSLGSLPPSEQHLARFLVLLPIATVVVSLFRVIIGIRTFGVFGPALLGLVFRDLGNLAWGQAIFAAVIIVGWLFRKVLDRFHLLLIPRAAVLLTLIISFLLVVVVVGSRVGIHVSGYLALFPLIILTHMVERFWTVEAEDGPRSSFKMLLGTLIVSAVVALVLSPDEVSRTVFRFPETLAIVVAVLLLLGRYTGYRITELYRFQDVIEPEPSEPPKAAGQLAEPQPGAKQAEPAKAGGVA